MTTAQPAPTSPTFASPAAALQPPAGPLRHRAVVQAIQSAMLAPPPAPVAAREERWPFTVRIVRTPQDLHKAVKVRSAAYGHHVPELGSKLAAPEEADAHDIVLLAEAKFDGTPIGTMRIRTNDAGPLQVQQVLELPPAMQGARLAEATRLAVRGAGDGRMVRDALFKAFYLVCVQLQVDYMVIGARKPLDRIYEWLDFYDVGAKGEFVPLPYANNIPHRIMKFDVWSIEERWQALKHPLLGFFFQIQHPDLHVGIGELDGDQLDQPLDAPVAA